jgi:hypothetical protein
MRRFVYILLSAAAAVLFFGMVPASAQAAQSTSGDAGLSYSTDGANYSADPPPIFADAPKVAPGDEVRGVLWIRNSRPRAVDVSIQTSQTDKISGIMLGPAGSGASTLRTGETTAISVRAWLPPTAGNEIQDQTSENMRVIVHASDAIPLAELPGPPDGKLPGKPSMPPGELGDTGYSAELLPLALGILVTGGALYAKSRRNSRKKTIAEGYPR